MGLVADFPFTDAGPGRAGPGMASAVAYRVPRGGLDAWMTRFAGEAVDFDGPSERFGERVIALTDPDGLRVELIEVEGAGTDDDGRADGEGRASDDGFHSVTLWLTDPEPTSRLLTELFGYEDGGEVFDGHGARRRLMAPGGGRGSAVDLLRRDDPSIGRQGAGTIHHVAFRATNDEVQRGWRERLAAAGLDVTPVIDRRYFNAIYFREPGGVLFEIATDPPGFAIDEAEGELGERLKLPPRHERRRADIERVLPPIRLPNTRASA